MGFKKRIFHIVRNVGIDNTTPVELLRKIYITNLFSFTLGAVIVGMALITLPFATDHLELYRIRLIIGGFYFLPFLFNLKKWYTLSRVTFVISPSVALLTIAALWGAEPATSLKIGLMPALILPILLFGVQEKLKMILGIVWGIGAILMLDLVVAVAPMAEWVEPDVFSNNREVNITIAVSMLLFFMGYILYQELIFRAEGSLHVEKERSDELLKNILPEEIIPILKENRDVIAEQYHHTSILFADIVGFTPFSSKRSAHDVVEFLDEVFSHFDDIVEHHKLEKIKTIGDCYMVAAGVPKPRSDHAEVLVDVAFEFREYIRSRLFKDEQMAIRIGISSGPVIAGVIGTKKFIYDLWGDTVNTASRMESHGVSDEIQITESTKLLIDSFYKCEQLENIHVKGKGDMAIYLVKEKIA